MLRSLKASLVFLLLIPGTALADNSVSRGTIDEMGYGKFILKETGGLERLYLVGKRDTSYTPDDWRPAAGDQVQVTWFEKKGKLVASMVTLVKLGPNSVDPKAMVSPLRVIVKESGRTGIIATIKGTSKQARFAYARKRTQFEPTGWQPRAGEEVEVDFEAEPSRFRYDISYVIDKITRIK